MATLLWPLMECFPGKTEQQLKQKGPLLKGHQEHYSVLSEVWFSHCKDVVMFSACLEVLEILHRPLFRVLKWALEFILKSVTEQGDQAKKMPVQRWK